MRICLDQDRGERRQNGKKREQGRVGSSLGSAKDVVFVAGDKRQTEQSPVSHHQVLFFHNIPMAPAQVRTLSSAKPLCSAVPRYSRSTGPEPRSLMNPSLSLSTAICLPLL